MISSRDDFYLGVWLFTGKFLHDLQLKCSPRDEAIPGEDILAPNRVNTYR